MTKMCFRKQLAHVVAIDDAASDFLKRLKPGQEFMAEARLPRNLKAHRWLFKLLQIVVENCDRYPNVETLLFALKIACGLCDPFPSADGKTVFMRPHSISFESMGEDEFAPLRERFVRIICEQIIPGTDSDALRAEVDSMISPSY